MKRLHGLILGGGLLLAGCGQPASSPSSAVVPPGPYADGVDHSWTASVADGQRLYSAFSQGLKTQGFGIGLKITATSGWGPIEINSSNGETAQFDGRPLSIGGQTYATGLGLHADSEIHIQATGLVTPACTRFQAEVGIDDEVGDLGSVTFQIFGDGEKLYDSGELTGAMGSEHVDIPLGGKSDLRFVTLKGANNYYDHADWAGARLVCVADVPQNKRPVITSVTGNRQIREYTNSGIVLQKATVTMTGQNLQNATIQFGTFGYGTNVLISADGTLLSVLSPIARNLVPMVVATPYGKINAGTFYDGYGEFRGQVHLLSISAISGPESGGAIVKLQLIGDVHFTPVPADYFDVYDIYFGSKKATNVYLDADGVMTAIAPPGTGDVDVTARCPTSFCYTLPGSTESIPFIYTP